MTLTTFANIFYTKIEGAYTTKVSVLIPGKHFDANPALASSNDLMSQPFLREEKIM
jgi:hypothetical protein